LPFFYNELKKLGFAELGFNATSDITACPGTDTCNLGIASSTGIAVELEKVLQQEYPRYINNKNITIKISGCMNACGQHNMAHIGFQGMSIRSGKLVAPALQVLLGGGVLGNGEGRFADKVIKVPSRRGPDALRTILNDFQQKADVNEPFLNYYDRLGEKYFYELLKPLADTDNLTDQDFIDWGSTENYVQSVGVGECAGVVIDLVATLLFESEEKLDNAREALKEGRFADAVYHAYAALINTAKALLIGDSEKTNSHAAIVQQFDELFVATGKFPLKDTFNAMVYQINQHQPSAAFAEKYLSEALSFYQAAEAFRKQQLSHAG